MLKYIQKMLPYPPTGAVLIIYNILAEQNDLQKYITFNAELDRFEFPIERLTNNPLFWKLAKLEGMNIEGTPIHWSVDEEHFCFWLE